MTRPTRGVMRSVKLRTVLSATVKGNVGDAMVALAIIISEIAESNEEGIERYVDYVGKVAKSHHEYLRKKKEAPSVDQ